MNNKKIKSYRVLVLEDDPLILNAFKNNLEDLSIHVTTALTAEDALKINVNEIDCIVSDIQLPGISGVEFIKKLEEKGIKKILFFVTGYQDYSKEELNKFSPQAIIFKPFDVEEVALLIKNHLMRLLR
jgi:DNA-binding response OmpR family regulator